jgi:hypothetical protein
MRVDLWLYASLGFANASVLKACVPQDQDAATAVKDIDGFQPKTHDPQFFSLMVDQQCRDDNQPTPPATKDCAFDGFAVRLENGIVVATRYNRWWSSKLTIFFVDDDKKIHKVRLPTFSHTLAVNESRPMILQVSGKLRQLFLDAVTGALRYADVGFLPPNSVAVSFSSWATTLWATWTQVRPTSHGPRPRDAPLSLARAPGGSAFFPVANTRCSSATPILETLNRAVYRRWDVRGRASLLSTLIR